MLVEYRPCVLAIIVVPVACEYMSDRIVAGIMSMIIFVGVTTIIFFVCCLGSDFINKFFGKDTCKVAPKRQHSKAG
jgi:uncharacterized membrane protein